MGLQNARESGEPFTSFLVLESVTRTLIAISPVLLGAGERLFEGVNLPTLGYSCTEHVATPRATHVVFTRV